MNRSNPRKRTPADGRTVLHRAAWLVPVNAPPVPDGAVLAQGETILDAGPRREVLRRCPAGAEVVDHGEAALLPGLVNAHTHLELSALRGAIPLPQPGFPSWLRELFSLRGTLSPEELERGAEGGERELASGGVCLYGDITNGTRLRALSNGDFPVRQLFLEVLGFHLTDLKAALPPDFEASPAPGDSYQPPPSLAAHSCYSTSAEVIRQAKEWTRKRGLPFSIHAAEHPEEMEFMQAGTGFCRSLLEMLGKWVPCWYPPAMSPVRYLDRLGALDARTMLVHAVHMDEGDWDAVARRGCSVCFCPRSNHNLNVGRPNVAEALRRGITLAIGTDSLAGNSDLNLFAEAAFLLQQYPEADPGSVLKMLTLGGARALGRDDLFGSIEPGKRARLLSVYLPGPVSASQIAEIIIHQGNKGSWQWASRPANA